MARVLAQERHRLKKALATLGVLGLEGWPLDTIDDHMSRGDRRVQDSAIYSWHILLWWLEGGERTDWAFEAKGVTNTPEEADRAMKEAVSNAIGFPRTDIRFAFEDFVPGEYFGPLHRTGIIAEVGLGVRDINEVVAGEASIIKRVPLQLGETAIANRKR